MGFDGMAALDEDDDSASEQEDELNLDHLDFKEVTSSDFRTNHVMGSGDLVGHAMAVAARRGIPVSTTVQFLQDDRDKLVDEIKSKIRIVNGRDDDPPNSLQNQQTSWEMLYVEVRPKKKGGHDLSEADFGKVRYAAQGYEMGHGRRGYEVNHLEGMT